MENLIEDIRSTVLVKVQEALETNDEIELHEDLGLRGLDSIRSIGLIADLESEFDILFDDDELLMQNFSTIEKIVKRVQRKIKC